jgi:hypothetical protein
LTSLSSSILIGQLSEDPLNSNQPIEVNHISRISFLVRWDVETIEDARVDARDASF